MIRPGGRRWPGAGLGRQWQGKRGSVGGDRYTACIRYNACSVACCLFCSDICVTLVSISSSPCTYSDATCVCPCVCQFNAELFGIDSWNSITILKQPQLLCDCERFVLVLFCKGCQGCCLHSSQHAVHGSHSSTRSRESPVAMVCGCFEGLQGLQSGLMSFASSSEASGRGPVHGSTI